MRAYERTHAIQQLRGDHSMPGAGRLSNDQAAAHELELLVRQGEPLDVGGGEEG
jgi:hypothetical protein